MLRKLEEVDVDRNDKPSKFEKVIIADCGEVKAAPKRKRGSDSDDDDKKARKKRARDFASPPWSGASTRAYSGISCKLQLFKTAFKSKSFSCCKNLEQNGGRIAASSTLAANSNKKLAKTTTKNCPNAPANLN